MCRNRLIISVNEHSVSLFVVNMGFGCFGGDNETLAERSRNEQLVTNGPSRMSAERPDCLMSVIDPQNGPLGGRPSTKKGHQANYHPREPLSKQRQRQNDGNERKGNSGEEPSNIERPFSSPKKNIVAELKFSLN